VVARACPVCGGTPPSSRSVYCKTACKQLAYRLRHQRLANVHPVVLRKQLQRQRLLVAHTVYECPSCEERYIGERRCSSCQLYCGALGLGGQCEDCDHIMLLQIGPDQDYFLDLFERELAPPCAIERRPRR